MSDQDPTFSQDFQQETSMNHLSTAAHHHSSAASKRPSALSSQEPSSKRANLNQASLAIATPSHLPRTFSEPIHSLEAINAAQMLQETSNAVQRYDPSPFANLNLGTPPRPRNSSGSPSCGESPSVKRLMRMKERMKDMSEWCNQVLSEGDEEDDAEFENNSDNIPKEESETVTEAHESVWVEMNGDGLVLNFRCPCAEGYQILLSGNNCYYKLTSF